MGLMKPLLSLPHYMFHQSHATCNFNAIKDTITSLQGMATTTQSFACKGAVIVHTYP